MTPNQTMDKARELARYEANGFLVEVAGRLAGLRIQMEYDLLL
jgi:ribosomal protein S3